MKKRRSNTHIGDDALHFPAMLYANNDKVQYITERRVNVDTAPYSYSLGGP